MQAMSRARVRLAVASLLLVACSLTSTSAAAAAPRPRLGVLVVFDQLPMWLLERYAPFFGPGGFGGLDGAVHSAWFPSASNETAPGHATLATGASPLIHGIATNTWFHDGKPRYVVEDDAFPLLAPVPGDPTVKLARGSSPRMLRVGTLGDAMKAESGGRAKVVTISHKDRSAILTAGHAADLAIWYDRELGRFTTSTAYADSLPAWLVEDGLALPSRSRREGTWEVLPVPTGLAALVPDDDRPGEGDFNGLDATFPHHLKDISDEKQSKNAWRGSPQSVDDLLTLALRAVDEVGLGRDIEPDLLVVSVSTTDVVGHNWGGDSLEQLDLLRRADQSLRRFMGALKQRVAGDVVVGLSSDHGAPPLPQTMTAAGVPAQPAVYEDVVAAADAALKKLWPKKDGSTRVQGFFPPQLFVDLADVDDDGRGRGIAAVIAAVEQVPGIARGYDMRPGEPDADAFHGMMRLAAPPGRTALVFVRQEPRVVLVEKKHLGHGTDHGSVYSYDRRVPFIIAGPGVKRGPSPIPVDVRDVAPTLAYLLGVPPPDACEGTPVPSIQR
jgi:predicted AlkP superfamily pyrophosphatase or phosphodiesterase